MQQVPPLRLQERAIQAVENAVQRMRCGLYAMMASLERFESATCMTHERQYAGYREAPKQ